MRTILTVSGLLLLAGCHDPYDWPGTWNASQVNAANIAAQVAVPQDLARGHGHPAADGQEAAAAVDRLRRGTVRALPDTSTSDVRGGSGAAPAASPAPGGAN